MSNFHKKNCCVVKTVSQDRVFLCSKIISCVVWSIEQEKTYWIDEPKIIFFVVFMNKLGETFVELHTYSSPKYIQASNSVLIRLF